MILALLPPNSRVIRFKLLSCAFLIIQSPTLVEPVKAILSIFGCLTKYYPTSVPPGRTFSTPAGTPASKASSPILKALNGVQGAGFKMLTHPVANTGAHFQAY